MRPGFLSRSQRIASIAELVISVCKGLIITAGYESKQILEFGSFPVQCSSYIQLQVSGKQGDDGM
jgi:hypothetical protein